MTKAQFTTLIKKFGVTAILVSTGSIEYSYTDQTNEISTKSTSITVAYGKDEVTGSFDDARPNRRWYIASNTEPKLGDKITIGRMSYVIHSIRTYKTSNEVLGYAVNVAIC